MSVEQPTNPPTPEVELPASIEMEPENYNPDDKNDLPPEEENKYKDGQVLHMVRVRFPGNSRSFAFVMGKRKMVYGQKVMAMSDRGMALGYINSFPYDLSYRDGMPQVRSISKVATEEDIKADEESYKRQKQVESLCQDLIVKHNLDMNLTHIEFTQFGKKAVFYFIAPARVDFRDLVKDLVQQLKIRVELRQISVRDRSASIGGLGPCGRELCCSSFLIKYGNVGVKMAKNQDLTLNFSKLNGVCGQLKCCLQYEDEVYAEKRKRLPKMGELIECMNGDKGRVDRLHLLSEQFEIIMPSGTRRRYVVDQFKHPLPDLKMPEFFENGISDDTKTVQGLEASTSQKTKNFETEILEIKTQSKTYADQIFQDLFGVKTLDASLPEVAEIDVPKIIKPKEEEEDTTPHVDPDLADLMTEEDAEYDEELDDITPPPAKNYQPQNQDRNRTPQHQQPKQQNNHNNNNRNNNHRRSGGGHRSGGR
jgi:cell fate regulator YaaT (PSP1 superfamily)